MSGCSRTPNNPSCDSGCPLAPSLLFTCLYTCSSHLPLFTCSHLPRPDSLIYHSTATHQCACLFRFCSGSAHSQLLLRWQIILEYDTCDEAKCAVRLLHPFVFTYALFACGCFSRCRCLFLSIELLIPYFPQHPLYSSSVVNYLCAPYGAQRIESGLINFWHVLDVVLTFNLSCVFVQVVRSREFRPLISLPKHDRL